MFSFKEVQAYIYDYGAKIKAPLSLLRIYDMPQPDGTPYLKICEDKYEYIFEERGFVFEKRETQDFNLLCYWIMGKVIFNLASSYELSHRMSGQDFRRVLFSKELELMNALNPEWGKILDNDIKDILKNAPYID